MAKLYKVAEMARLTKKTPQYIFKLLKTDKYKDKVITGKGGRGKALDAQTFGVLCEQLGVTLNDGDGDAAAVSKVEMVTIPKKEYEQMQQIADIQAHQIAQFEETIAHERQVTQRLLMAADDDTPPAAEQQKATISQRLRYLFKGE